MVGCGQQAHAKYAQHSLAHLFSDSGFCENGADSLPIWNLSRVSRRLQKPSYDVQSLVLQEPYKACLFAGVKAAPIHAIGAIFPNCQTLSILHRRPQLQLLDHRTRPNHRPLPFIRQQSGDTDQFLFRETMPKPVVI